MAVLAASWVVLPLVEMSLRWRSGAALRTPAPLADVTPGSVDPASLARLVETAARLQPLPARCLARSLWLRWLLHRHGHLGVLRLGCRRTPQGLQAHAWIEHDGHPLNDTADVAERFPAFADLPPPTRRPVP